MPPSLPSPHVLLALLFPFLLYPPTRTLLIYLTAILTAVFLAALLAFDLHNWGTNKAQNAGKKRASLTRETRESNSPATTSDHATTFLTPLDFSPLDVSPLDPTPHHAPLISTTTIQSSAASLHHNHSQLPPPLLTELATLIDLITRDFILHWYLPLSTAPTLSPTFPNLVTDAIAAVLGNLCTDANKRCNVGRLLLINVVKVSINTLCEQSAHCVNEAHTV